MVNALHLKMICSVCSEIYSKVDKNLVGENGWIAIFTHSWYDVREIT